MALARSIASLLFICITCSVRADEDSLVSRWDFGTEGSSPYEAHGDVLRDQAGPRPPVFPDFQDNNTAVKLGDGVGYLSIDDSSKAGQFDFNNGDEITLEAWVKLETPAHSSPVYIVGKGRSGSPRFAKDNQNWALRLQKKGDQIHLSFLFATKPSTGDKHWHRWTSKGSFAERSQWHHVAVTYRFGKPDSIRGWIDGQATDGNWDMGGPTTQPPIVDDDVVWIGSGTKGNRFVGLLDNVAIHRSRLSDEVMATRFRRVGEEPQPKLAKSVMPDLGPVPSGQVLTTLCDGMPSSNRWINEDESWPKESMRWTSEAFFIHRLPTRYDEWGIRDAWKETVLVQMAADVEFPAGSHRLLLRARGMGRLWIDGQLIAETKPVAHSSPDGEQLVTPVAKPPVSGVRPHGYRQQEVMADLEVPTAKRSRVVWELIVGGKNQRTEPGEACVGIQFDGSDTFHLLTPQGADPLPLADLVVEQLLVQLETHFTSLDDHSRRKAASSQDAYWEIRHQHALNWLAEHPTPVPTMVNDASAHPVDVFIASKIDDAKNAAANSDSRQTAHFYDQVLPILRDECFRCHGEKQKGGLKLNSRESALLAGESEQPAIVPGDPDASELVSQIRSGAMPPTETGLKEQQIVILEQWIKDGAVWPAPPVDHNQIALAPIISDESFLRRVYLDAVGQPPTLAQAQQFFSGSDPNKRLRLIEQLLDDPRFADHWINLWLDLLAENPTLINPTMGSTGPFRWFLYDSLRDNKPVDRMVSELIMMRGSPDTGGSAGFSLSGESDAPLADKAHILAGAFLGIELQCARCHDSPYHSTKQRDLYSLAAMLERKPVKVPATSRVPDAFFEKKGRESLIRVTLKPGESIDPKWPLADAIGWADDPSLNESMHNAEDSRERLAILMTSPQNPRFGRVLVNRIWKQLMGAGFVESVNDWEGKTPSHPELLDWLVGQLIQGQYDVRVVMKQIMTSEAYQREAVGQNAIANADQRFFASPDRRRLSAEQIVDSLFQSTGSEMDVEELTFVHDGQRSIGKRQSLGRPKRAWMMASLNNERDRPSLSLPRARSVTDVLEAFGWTGSRPKPISTRDTQPNVLQPGILSNGSLVMSLSRASWNSQLSKQAIEATSAESLVDHWFLRILCRRPTDKERHTFAVALQEGFDNRLVPEDQIELPQPLPQLPLVSWFNHLQSETTTIQQELERRVNLGPPPDPRLQQTWRAAYEDFIWSLINHREFAWIP